MRKRKYLGIGVTVLTLVLTCMSGCGEKELTLEDILAKVNENTEAASGMTGDMAMKLEGSISASGMSLDMGMEMNMKIESSQKDDAEMAHLTGTMDISMLGQEMTMEMENYSVQDGSTIKSYSCTDGEWTYSEGDADELAEMAGSINDLYKDAKNWTLAEEKEDKGGVSCYVLNGTVSGKDMQGYADMLGEISEEETDLSKIEMPITLYVDAEKLLPVYILVDGAEAMNKMMEGTEAEGSEFSEFSITVENVKYGDVKITISEEALAAENGGSLSGEPETEPTETEPAETEPETKEAITPQKGNKPSFGNSGSTSSGTVVSEGFPITLVDDENCLVQVTGIDDSDDFYYELEMYLENKSDVTLSFQSFAGSVNGVMISPWMSEDVNAGKKMNTNMEFYKENLEANGTANVTDIAFLLEVYDPDHYEGDYLTDEIFHVYPQGQAAAVVTERPAAPEDIVLLDNEYVTIIVTGFSEDEYYGPCVNTYMVNKTDSFLMVAADDVSVNGFMIDPFWAQNVLPGAALYSNISWYEEDLKANNISSIDDISEVEMTVTAYDQQDWSIPDFFTETCTITR